MRSSLAMRIRADPRFDELIEQLWVAAVRGVDSVSGDRISIKESREAKKLLLLYGIGQPPQYVVLDAEVRADVGPKVRYPWEGASIDAVRARRSQLEALKALPVPVSVSDPDA